MDAVNKSHRRREEGCRGVGSLAVGKGRTGLSAAHVCNIEIGAIIPSHAQFLSAEKV